MLQPTSEDAPPAAAPLAVTQPTPVPTSQRARRGSQATSVRSGFDLCFFTDPPTEERDCSLRAPSAAAIEEAATVVGSSSASWVATSSSGPAGEKPPAGIAGDKEGQGEDEVIYVGLASASRSVCAPLTDALALRRRLSSRRATPATRSTSPTGGSGQSAGSLAYLPCSSRGRSPPTRLRLPTCGPTWAGRGSAPPPASACASPRSRPFRRRTGLTRSRPSGDAR